MPWSTRDPNEFVLEGPDEFGPWGREMRGVHQVTSDDVAEAMDVKRTQVCSWERGDIVPNLKSAIKMVHAHGYEIVFRRKRAQRG